MSTVKAFNIAEFLKGVESSEMTKSFTRSTGIRPMVNVHPFIDYMTGRMFEGGDGCLYVNGGLAPFTGIGGVPNMFKTALADDMALSVLNNLFPYSEAMKFDTEDSATIERYDTFRKRHDILGSAGGMDWIRSRFIVTNTNREEGGDQAGSWWKRMQLHCKEHRASKKRPKRFTYPHILEETQPDGSVLKKPYKSLPIFVSVIDSMSELPIEKVDEMFDSNLVGSSDNNTEAMRGGSAKTQLIRQIPGFANEFKWYIIATAHLGKRVEMDPNKPPQEMLAYLQGLNFKHTPEKFAFLTNNCFVATSSRPMLESGVRTVTYPYFAKDELSKNDTDLVKVKMSNVRGKNGKSGEGIYFVASQTWGVDWDLTSWEYLREHSNYGIEMKHGGRYHLHLYPEFSVTRNTVREAIRDNAKFRQALRLTIAIRLIKDFWGLSYSDLRSPQEVYEILTGRGIDMEVLFDTREYWTYPECEKTGAHKKPMTALMLQEMARDESYKPYWYDKALKEKQKEAATAKVA